MTDAWIWKPERKARHLADINGLLDADGSKMRILCTCALVQLAAVELGEGLARGRLQQSDRFEHHRHRSAIRHDAARLVNQRLAVPRHH